MKNSIVVVQICRPQTGTKLWIYCPTNYVNELVKNDDCSRLELYVDQHYPGWFFIKWALVPKDFKKIMEHGLEEMESFGLSF